MNSKGDRVKKFAKHSYGAWNRQKAWTAPLLITDAEGVYMYDHSGKPYLDFSSQLMCSNLGHKNQAVISAVVEQAERLPYVAPGFANEASIAAVEALCSIMPKGLDRFFFSTSGTEANEAALKLVRQSKAPAYKLISRYHSYHGATPAGAGLTGDPRRWFSERARCVRFRWRTRWASAICPMHCPPSCRGRCPMCATA